MKRKALIILAIFLPFIFYGIIMQVVTQKKINDELQLIKNTIPIPLNYKGKPLKFQFVEDTLTNLTKYFNHPYNDAVYYPSAYKSDVQYFKELKKIYELIKENNIYKKNALFISQTLRQEISYKGQTLRLQFLSLAKDTNHPLFYSEINNLNESFHLALQKELLEGVSFFQSNSPEKEIEKKHGKIIAFLYKFIGVKDRDFIYYLTSMKNCEEIFALLVKNKNAEEFLTHSKHFDSFLFRSANLIVPYNQIRTIYPLAQKLVKLQKIAKQKKNSIEKENITVKFTPKL